MDISKELDNGCRSLCKDLTTSMYSQAKSMHVEVFESTVVIVVCQVAMKLYCNHHFRGLVPNN